MPPYLPNHGFHAPEDTRSLTSSSVPQVTSSGGRCSRMFLTPLQITLTPYSLVALGSSRHRTRKRVVESGRFLLSQACTWTMVLGISEPRNLHPQVFNVICSFPLLETPTPTGYDESSVEGNCLNHPSLIPLHESSHPSSQVSDLVLSFPLLEGLTVSPTKRSPTIAMSLAVHPLIQL